MSWQELKQLGVDSIGGKEDVKFARCYENKEGKVCGFLEFGE